MRHSAVHTSPQEILTMKPHVVTDMPFLVAKAAQWGHGRVIN